MTALYKQQLGELIRRMREDLGLTQKQLAERAHVAESQTVSRWERGERAPQDLEAVAAALETTVPEMLRQVHPISERQRASMNANGGRSQLDRIEAALQEQTHLLRQVLDRLGALERAASILAAGGEALTDEAVRAAIAALLGAPQTRGRAGKGRAKRASRPE